MDKFSDVLVVQSLALGIDKMKMTIIRLLEEVLAADGVKIRGVFERSDAKVREQEGMERVKGFLSEPFDTSVEIVENGVHYLVDVKDGQKTGFFLDQKYNRLAVQKLCKDARVLDCFTHTGSFALNAAYAGAKEVIGVDASELGVEQARKNASLNGLENVASFVCEDVFELLPRIEKEGEKYRPRIVWDMAPGYLTEHEEYMDKINWRHSLVAKCSDMEDVYDKVTKEFDTLLAKHGYVRENGYYRVEKESTETITLFCHFGLICVLLSHLWNVSPFTLWNSFALAPTSVTEVVTEERKQGIAYFRGLKIGDISHLYAGDEEPSFAARFCETYSNKEQRH